MSGGHFDYKFRAVDDFSYDLEYELRQKDLFIKNKEVIDILKGIVREADKFAKIMKEVEWMFSCDTGEDTFLERYKGLIK